MKTTQDYLIEFVTEIGILTKDGEAKTLGEALRMQLEMAELFKKYTKLIETSVMTRITSTQN